LPGVSRPPELADVAHALRAQGLALRGAFHCDPEEAPPLPDGRRAGTLVLAGQAGASSWERFTRERRDEPDPLDAWSARALAAVAERFAAAFVLPRPGLPFQRWAQRAEALQPSPLGLLIHPEYGLWHAYRGALLFAERLALAPPAAPARPCDACDARPCLRACPVGAFAPAGPAVRYDAAGCVAHVASPAGRECRERGCRARRACPVGAAYAYGGDQQRFHMEAFLAAHRAG